MQMPSILEAPLPAHAPTLGISAVLKRLEEADLPLSNMEPAPPDDPELEWALNLVYADEVPRFAKFLGHIDTSRPLKPNPRLAVSR